MSSNSPSALSRSFLDRSQRRTLNTLPPAMSAATAMRSFGFIAAGHSLASARMKPALSVVSTHDAQQP
jgi:hypothetical protein